MKQCILLLLLGITLFVSAQSRPAPQKPKNEFAANMLSAAEAGASNLQGIDRAYAYWLISRVFAGIDVRREREVLKKSCEAALAPDPDPANSTFRNKVQFDCIRRMKALQPKTASQLLAMATAEVRQQILAEQAVKTARSGDLDTALTMLSSEIGQGARYPYEHALEMIRTLPTDDRSGKDRVFAQALGYYRQKQNRFDVGIEDLGTFVVRFWRELSPGLVLMAIDEILDTAREEDAADSHLELKLTSGSNVVMFGSLYQYRLFQLLPVIRAFDPSRADDLVQQNVQAGSALAKYTSGLASLSNSYSGAAASDESFTMTFQVGSGPGRTDSGTSMRTSEIYRHGNEILAAFGKDPDAALSNALLLQDEPGPTGSPKAEALLRIAQLSEKNHPGVAVNALQEMNKLIENFSTLDQCRYLILMGERYLRLKRPDLARSVVAEAMRKVKKLYEVDTNSDDPNLALKSSWPSTAVSRACVSIATQVSSKLADETIQDLPDPDLRVFARIERASGLVRMPSYPALIQERHKENRVYRILAFPIPSAQSQSVREQAMN
ncbi:MAG TPA: hypothetical protein VF532_11730 [Candidatus Angelobacter sp.]